MDNYISISLQRARAHPYRQIFVMGTGPYSDRTFNYVLCMFNNSRFACLLYYTVIILGEF